MARKSESTHQRVFNIAVVGLSGTEKEKGCMGVGKSCLCNRFVRPLADDYNTEHISVLSQTDFSGRIVNNDHWLYWGEAVKTSDEGVEVAFSVVEQTEFVDDACFQPFKSGKTEPYYKRCAALRLSSAEKMMYICKNQLGIEKEYEQRYLTDGRFIVDGFVCVFDVSEIQGRSIEKQVELTALILNNLLRTKRPIVLATTKHDEASDYLVREAERLVNRKEFRGIIPLVETSAHENVNVDLPFVVCAQLMDRTKGKSKITSYYESSRSRKESMEMAIDAYQSLIRSQVTDFRTLWNSTYKKLNQSHDFLVYCDLFGQESAHLNFKRHVRKLKEDYIERKMQMYLRVLPEVLSEMLPDLDSIGDECDWNSIKERLRMHPDFDQYFVDSPDQLWHEIDFEDTSETRIPFDLLDTAEAEQVYVEHKVGLENGERRRDLRHQFKQLLQETGFVTPGKSLGEVRVLFMGRECYESLTEQDIIDIYEEHQKEISDRAKSSFQELLLEHSNLFYHFASLGPGNVITQDDIGKITDALQDDCRYKALDRLDQDRTLILLRHLGFIHGPIREHCPAYPNCMDVLIEKASAARARRPPLGSHNNHWLYDCENNHLNLVLLGIGGLSEELASALRGINETFDLDKTRFTLDFRVIDGDVDMPNNSFRTSDFSPQGCFCIYSNHQSLEYIRQSLEKTLLSDLEQEDRLPFHGLPIVIIFAANPNINEKDLIYLREEGQNRAKSLQCPFLDVTNFDNQPDIGHRFDHESLTQALRALIESIQRRVGLIQIYQSTLPEHALNPDLRILMCLHCGDPFNLDQVMTPFFNHHVCYVTSANSFSLEFFLDDSKKYVEFVATSYHGAQAYRDELLHGFLLFYSSKRKASLATLSAFTGNIPNTPIQMVAVSDNSNSNIYYSNHDLSLQLLSEGNVLADKLQAHFTTLTSPSQQKASFLNDFLKEVLERKPQIEKAFDMDDSDYSLERRTPIPPPVPSRQESYHIRSGSVEDNADSDGIYEQLPDKSGDNNGDLVSSSGFVDGTPLSPSDESEVYAGVFSQENGGEHLVKPSQIKNRRSLQAGYGAYPPPPEPAPDYPLSRVKKSLPPHHRTFEEAEDGSSQELLPSNVHSGWMDNRIYEREDQWLDNDMYHAYHSGRHKLPPPLKPKPGKLNLKQFDNITDAIGRLNLSQRQGTSAPKMGLVHAPLATPEGADPSVDFPHDSIYTSQDYYSIHNSIGDGKHRIRSLTRRSKDPLEKRAEQSPSDGSDKTNEEEDGEGRNKSKSKRSFQLRRRAKLPPQSRSVPDSNFEESPGVHASYSMDTSSKAKIDSSSLSCMQPAEDDFDPRDAAIRQLGKVLKSKSATTVIENNDKMTRKERENRKKTREDEKLEKRRLKEEERQKRHIEKKKKKQNKANAGHAEPGLEDFVQSEDMPVPLFVEKCIQFIEEEGLESEGIYRVPGNRAHVDLLFQKFDEDPNVSIRELDVPVNAVATALKDFFSKRLPPLIPSTMMDELTEVSSSSDKSNRISAFKEFLKNLPPVNFQVTKYIFQHFVKVTEHSRLNSMDSKNLAICWWPTLLPFEFNDMVMFERMRPHLEDAVQMMIDQFKVLFNGEDEVLMV